MPKGVTPVRTAITHHDVATLLAEGQIALQSHDFREAVNCFRKAVYIAPEDPIACFNLGLAMEQSGHAKEAVRAFRAARAALRQSDSKRAEAALEGYDVNELSLLLDARIGEREG
jgi:Flp pilus assembly protein TadD